MADCACRAKAAIPRLRFLMDPIITYRGRLVYYYKTLFTNAHTCRRDETGPCVRCGTGFANHNGGSESIPTLLRCNRVEFSEEEEESMEN